MSDRSPAKPRGIDPRGPRFAAGDHVAAAAHRRLPRPDRTVDAPATSATATVAERFLDPAFLLLLATALLFLWGVLSPRTAPWGVLFRKLVQPRLAPPPNSKIRARRASRRASACFVVGIGLVLHLLGVPWALPIAAALAFVAAFLNAVFGLCLGCQLYLLLQRAGLVGRERAAAA